LSRLDQVRAVFAQIKEAYPQGIDVSILNAGITGVYPIEIAEEAEFDSIFNTNVKGTVFAAQESIKQLKDGGKLLFMSTAGTHATFPGLAFYNASKAAVDQFVRVLAVELGPRKISVNSIAPSTIETDLLPQAFREWGANASVFKRIGHPEDVALAVVGVLQAPWITGAVVPVTGGSIIF
jgi:3-oxoacyl-[acyl-carrier protein] reductase